MMGVASSNGSQKGNSCSDVWERVILITFQIDCNKTTRTTAVISFRRAYRKENNAQRLGSIKLVDDLSTRLTQRYGSGNS